MLLKGRSQEVAEKVIDAFRTGNIAAPLATAYLIRTDDKPVAHWSALNQFICLLFGCTDPRGYDQWKQAGRQVRKGEKAQAHIMVPIRPYQRKSDRQSHQDDDETGQTAPIIGFTTCPVFDVSQTDGDPITEEHPHRDFLDALPLVDVARHWHIHTDTYTGQGARAKGYFVPRQNAIFLGVENINTWLHELTHAADYRLGNLTETGQHWRSETVAQLGACVLAHMIGCPEYADEGKTFRYITSYAEEAKIETITACGRVLERTLKAVDLILTQADAVTPVA
ncbi:MAG: hypothetical protein KA314_13540 [Chloroflexi bacterium]|nr:hypothetical protein [Chloroflexota bacterium]